MGGRHVNLRQDPVTALHQYKSTTRCGFKAQADQDTKVTAMPQANSRIARIDSFNTLQTEVRLLSLGRLRPISHKYTAGVLTPARCATSVTDKPRLIRVALSCTLKLTFLAKR
jgi:hypothetical protein